jgi:hypothetical protein
MPRRAFNGNSCVFIALSMVFMSEVVVINGIEASE